MEKVLILLVSSANTVWFEKLLSVVLVYTTAQNSLEKRNIMQRKLYHKLLDWKTRGAKKPLMLIGARQVGKTYLVREFCEREFDDYIEVNLFERTDIVELFKENLTTQQKVSRLQLFIGKPIDFSKTVLFFDEIQESEELISTLKHFAESDTAYRVICAGSLLGVKINRFKGSFPVGQIEKLQLYPMDFEEFLLAGREAGLVAEIRICFDGNKAISSPLHQLCLERYRSYLCTGGMPAAIVDFLDKDRDILRFDASILTDIRTDYLSDMTRYINTPYESTRIETIYASLPAQLGNKSKKFQYSRVKEGAKSREYYSALDWLTSSQMVFRCSQDTLSQKPLCGYEREGLYKIFLNDVDIVKNGLGILFSDIMLDRELSYKGVIAENYVATQLVASGHQLFYWFSGNEAEIDFLIERPEGVVPIEVKAGDHKRSASLVSYSRVYEPPYAIRMTTRNFGYANSIKSVPLYAAFCITKEN